MKITSNFRCRDLARILSRLSAFRMIRSGTESDRIPASPALCSSVAVSFFRLVSGSGIPATWCSAIKRSSRLSFGVSRLKNPTRFPVLAM